LKGGAWGITKKFIMRNKIKIGIPRILNMYENLPFWYSLISGCGFTPVLSDDSTDNLYKKGSGALMSDNICFPAKLSHGHIVNLIEKKVDRIFLPFVVYEKGEFKNSFSSYNCPIVTAYSEVLKSTVCLAEYAGIPFDSPVVNFNKQSLLKKACFSYLKNIGVDKKTFEQAFKHALSEQLAQWWYDW